MIYGGIESNFGNSADFVGVKENQKQWGGMMENLSCHSDSKVFVGRAENNHGGLMGMRRV